MQTKKNELRIGQTIINDILKDIEIKIAYCEPKHGFVTSVVCSKLFNMTDKEFNERYLNANDERNPAHFCCCGKFIGRRGFCSQKCHDEYYDTASDVLTNMGG